MSPEQVRGLIFGQSRGAHFIRRWPSGIVPYTIDWSLGKLRSKEAKISLKRKIFFREFIESEKPVCNCPF